MSELTVATLLPEHWDDVARIYGEGIATGQATFETEIPAWEACENEASVRLHERVGFRVLGVRERLGRLHGSWRDVLFLERRSTVTG